MRRYEIKIWQRGSSSPPDWRFFIHHDGTIEMIKDSTTITAWERKLIDQLSDLSLGIIENTNMGDVHINYVIL